VIFVTAFDEYALRAFEVNAVDYLLKPLNPERFDKALRRAMQRLSLRAEGRYASRFAVRAGSAFSFVRASEIDWIDGADNYVRLHVSGREHLLRDTLKSIESQLQPDIFVRVHRSIIVNIDRVAAVQPHQHGEYVVMMKDGARFNTSRSYSDRLRTRLQTRNTRA
jgi:two-component system, LytTR family, response regulator